MGKTAAAIDLTQSERRELESLTSRRKTAQGLAQRARIVLHAAEGGENKAISLRVGAAPNTVGKWRRRFGEHRVAGLYDEPRPGAPRQIGDEAIAGTIRQTLETTPADATHWSLRSMARAVGHAPSTIHRIWRAFGLQPHRSETFKLSTDPLFVEKVRDIVGLYLAPPERAMVLCVDEKSQIQALDRTQPLLPMRPGQAERRSHDYTRHGTLSLFAALDTATGKVVGRCFARHRAREFRAFLNTIEAHVPPDLDVHIIMDNVSSHKTQTIRNWFAGGRAGMCTTPRPRRPGSVRLSASSQISPTNKSAAASVAPPIELQTAMCFGAIDAINASPKPFISTKTQPTTCWPTSSISVSQP